MARISLDLLQQFVLAARLGNLSRAAEQANLTVSALSHQIRQLEQRVERKLFDRGPRGVQLTAEGRRLQGAVAHHFEGIDRALANYRCRREEALTINTLPSVMSSWLVPRLARLVAAHPELELNLQSSTGLVDFERDPVDVAIRYGRGVWPGVESEKLFDEWIAPVVAPVLLERMRDTGCDDVSGWPLLGDPGDRWHDWFADIGGSAPNRYVAKFDTTDALQRAALEGMGVALGRMVMARPLIDAGLLHVLGKRYQHIPDAYYLVYPARSKDHAGLRIFRDWIHAEAVLYGQSMAHMSGRH
ncbi:LysR substrate-binding domain-containing protein [Dyella tabacisoli]|uniref:LysR family transcriptional regulator n=1 Tax=Dyella tabacisoli TaxID=2282381 RepID=A0A369UIX9_9GAMM|nr:LysR substrate-binding domain-containing protein [Dyella tabacisoli]RDD80702.1 LysR family transcriptional regulator [Dyella tabacisoli]